MNLSWITALKCISIYQIIALSSVAAKDVGVEDNRHHQHSYSGGDDIQSLMTTLKEAFSRPSSPLRQGQQQGRRASATYGCDEVVATISKLEADAVLREYIYSFAPPATAPFLYLAYQRLLKYGLEVRTVCASCQSEATEALYMNDAFNKYCGKDVYGNDIEHSGLVMIPLVEGDEADTFVEKPGTLPGYILNRPTKVGNSESPSQVWGDSEMIEPFFGFFATVTIGAVSFSPDYMGFGLSQAERGFLVKDLYATATMPLWMKVSSDLSSSTKCRTALADSAFFTGYSEGGYASIMLAEAFSTALNVEVIRVSAGGTPFQGFNLKNFVIANDLGLTTRRNYMLLMTLGVTYSSYNPHVANFNTGQNLLKDEYMNPSNPDKDVHAWLGEPNMTIEVMNQRVEDIVSQSTAGSMLDEFMNPDILTWMRVAIANNITDPCAPTYPGYVVGENDKFCEALKQTNIMDSLINVNYTFLECHAQDDEVMPVDDLPDMTQNPNLSLVVVPGSHYDGGTVCLTNEVTYMGRPDFQTYIPSTSKHSVDSKLRFKVTLQSGKKAFKNCNWVKTRATASRCRLKQVKRICSATCGICALCADSNLRFKVKKNDKIITRDCKWVKTKSTKARCALDGVADTCRSTCGTC